MKLKAGDKVRVIEPAVGSGNGHFFKVGDTGEVEEVRENLTLVRMDGTGKLMAVETASLTLREGGAS